MEAEEKKAWALIEEGYDGSFYGEAYGSVAFQNVNQSVRATDDFMEAAVSDPSVNGRGSRYDVLDVAGNPIGQEDAWWMPRLIAEGTYVCGDPGMQFSGTIDRWHTVPQTSKTPSSNTHLRLTTSTVAVRLYGLGETASPNCQPFYGSACLATLSP